MSSKKGILYGVYHDWTEEISVVYEMDKEGYFPENKLKGKLKMVNLTEMEFGLSVVVQHMLVIS
jgi:hypothetical protein